MTTHEHMVQMLLWALVLSAYRIESKLGLQVARPQVVIAVIGVAINAAGVVLAYAVDVLEALS